MMRVETFSTLREAAAALVPGACYLGGGTLAMRALNHGEGGYDRVLRTTDPGLREIRAEAERVVIGAGVTLAQVIAHRDLEFLAPVARSIGGPAVRNMGTVGGNLFAPHPYGDLAAALLALDGEARMADGGAMPLADLLARRDGPAGLVAAVTVARPRPGEFRYRKVSRTRPKGASVLSISAWLPLSAGRIGAARVAYAAMGPAPMRVTAVERALDGATLDPQGVARAVAAAGDGISPPDDALASGWYRAEVVGVHLRRLLLGEG